MTNKKRREEKEQNKDEKTRGRRKDEMLRECKGVFNQSSPKVEQQK